MSQGSSHVRSPHGSQELHEKAALLALGRLGQWFDRQKRVLPWRDQPTLYRVWVSEIMLQQTQVITVVPYFERFVARFPTVEALAAASEEEVMSAWAGLGYYSRARNLRKTAQKVVERGDFPRTRQEWLEMPGVGEYTAGAILSIALNQPEAILDGNVERVLSRVYCVDRSAGDAAYKQRLWDLSRSWVEKIGELPGGPNAVPPSVLNQALMELGATFCSVRSPRCELCPLREICQARATEKQEAYPPKKKPKEWLQVQEEMDCLIQGGPGARRCLVRLRQAGEWRAGLWDLPEKGSLEASEFSRASFLGEIEGKHVVTRHKILRRTRLWQLAPQASSALSGASSEFRWISLNAPEVPIGSPLRKTLQRLLERYPDWAEASSAAP